MKTFSYGGHRRAAVGHAVSLPDAFPRARVCARRAWPHSCVARARPARWPLGQVGQATHIASARAGRPRAHYGAGACASFGPTAKGVRKSLLYFQELLNLF
jgi:hypothetical protein